jgi:hypothetical protein
MLSRLWISRVFPKLTFHAALIVSAAGLLGLNHAVSAEPDDGLEFFEKKVRPLLANNCYGCHSADTNSKGGLRVDDRNGDRAGKYREELAAESGPPD